MLRSVDHAAGTFAHLCAGCRREHESVPLDPAAGRLRVESSCFVVVCPDCDAITCYERDVPPWLADHDILHPDSMVGQRFADTGGVVVQDHRAGSVEAPLTEHRRRQAVLSREMQRHPHLAPHAPLPKFRHRRRGGPLDVFHDEE